MNCEQCGAESRGAALCNRCATQMVRLSTGAKVWSVICIAASTFTLFANLAMGLVPMAVLGVCGISAYLWLLMGKRRMAFYAIIGTAVLTLLINMAVYGLGPTALTGLLNPLITYAFLYRAWPQMR